MLPTPMELSPTEPAAPQQDTPAAPTTAASTPTPTPIPAAAPPRSASRHITKSSSTVFVGNLDARVTESVLAELFTQCGPIDDVLIPSDPRGLSKGFAFVDYCDECAVGYACELLDGIALYGRILRVRPAAE